MAARRDLTYRLKHYARAMRREPTDAERKLWELLRDRRLGGFKFRRQVPVAGYVLDFFCEAASLAVEVDGRQHGESEAVAHDEARSARLAEVQIKVIRFDAGVVVKEPLAVARTILRVLTTGE